MAEAFKEAVIGIDLGTQGARVLAVDPRGNLLGAAQKSFPVGGGSLPAGWLEQSPRAWWLAVQAALRELVAQLPNGTRIAGISVDSTSGTVLPVNAQGEPLADAIMYNDRRSEPQVAAVQAAGTAYQDKLGYRFGSSYALPKICWLKQERPEIYQQAARILHAADFIAGQLTGCFDRSDTSNALKTGYDLIDLRWPDYIERDLGIDLRLLPEVVLPGQPVGSVSRQAAEGTGLPEGAPVFAGATDGTAAQIASGASQPGDWNSTLGTTLVLKGISRDLALDPLGRVYFHRHPEGWWMPGGASNTGGEWIPLDYPGVDPAALDRQAEGRIPTALLRYPLPKRGERFPFIAPQAEGFLVGTPKDESERYAAGLEGLALLERLAYDMVQQIGLAVGERLFITGGGSKSALWSRIRASVLNRQLLRPAVTETAMGAAILAASGCWYGSLSQAAQNMARIAQVIDPDPALTGVYEARYASFVAELTNRGYIR